MFRQFLCPLSGVFSLYTRQWYMLYRLADSLLASCQPTWWWMEELSETCRVFIPKQIWEICASGWFYYRNFSRCMVIWMSKTSLSIERFDYSVLFLSHKRQEKITRHAVALSHFVTVLVTSHNVWLLKIMPFPNNVMFHPGSVIWKSNVGGFV